MSECRSSDAPDILYLHGLSIVYLLYLPLFLRYDIIYLKSTYRLQWWARGLRKGNRVVSRVVGRELSSIDTPFVDVRFTPEGETIDGFQPMDLQAKRTTTDVLRANIDTDAVDQLASMFDREGAESFYIKGTAHYGDLNWSVLDLIKLTSRHDTVDHLLVPHFRQLDLPISGCQRVGNPNVGIDLYLAIRGLTTRISLTVMLAKRYLRGDSPEHIAGEAYTIANEVGDPSYMDGKAGQPDYLVDGTTLTDDDTLYYMTSHPVIGGVSDEEVERFVAGTASFVDLRTTAPSLLRCCRMALQFWRYDARSVSDLQLLRHAATVWIEFDTLYRYADIDYDTTPTFSNDKRRARLDSGLVTAIANEHDTVNVNYQTRPFYIYSWEHNYDSVDKLYVWSDEWTTASRKRAFDYVDDTEVVGNVFLTTNHDDGHREDLVSVFTTDINANDRHTLAYNRTLLDITLELARSYPGYEFLLKPKFENQRDKLLDSVEDPPANFSVEGDLYETDSLIDRSTVTIAIGVTSPGVDAFMRGVNTIYYSDIGELDGPLGDAEFVCGTRECILELFKRYDEGYTTPADILDQFDPFRDGQARDRILADLLSDRSAQDDETTPAT